MGLLLAHKSTCKIYPDMVVVSENFTHKQTGGGRRNEIHGFSKQSRYRLFRLLHSIRFERVSFVTLTYGNTFPLTGRSAKADLRRFRRSTNRRYGTLRAIWKLEYQKRGAPHFHLMVFDPPFIPVQDWCAVWDDARRCPQEERHGNSLDLKVDNKALPSRALGKYVGKYISKPDRGETEELHRNTGRIWGKWDVIEQAPIEVELYSFEADRLTKLLLPDPDSGGWQPKNRRSYSVFGPQFGSEGFAQDIVWKIQMLLLATRRVEGVNRTNVTRYLDMAPV